VKFKLNFPYEKSKIGSLNSDSVKPCCAEVSRGFSDNKSNNGGQSESFYFLNIFKPRGITSFDVIYKLRKRLKTKKIGHSGTLDPLAEGVMQVGVGKATRLLDYLGSDKKYVAKIRFGYLSSTCDSEGVISFFNVPKFTKDELLSALKSMTGTIEQIPPAFSAVKTGGKKLCDLARKGGENSKNPDFKHFEENENQAEILTEPALMEDSLRSNSLFEPDFAELKNEKPFCEQDFSVLKKRVQNEPNFLMKYINQSLVDVEIPKRNVTIYEAKLLDFTQKASCSADCCGEEGVKPNMEATIEIFCSKGTYIRSFAVDLAQKLGTCGYLTDLKRTLAGNFKVEDSIQIDDVKPETDGVNPCCALNLPFYELNYEECKKVLNGVGFSARNNVLETGVKKLHNFDNSLEALSNQHFMLIFENKLVSIAVLSDNNFVCKKVFK